MMETYLTLVTGARGALGQLVCRHLAASRDVRLAAASRSPEKLAFPAEAGVELRRVDFDEPSTLDQAFSGVRRALIISTDELARPGHRQRQHKAALEAALRSGVHHVAYTSMPNPATSAAIPFAADHAAMEEDLRDSGLQYSILRNSWYQENLLSYLPQIVRDGVWYTAAGAGRIAYVARDDAAAAAARAISSDQGLGIVDIAGPVVLTIDDIAGLVSDAVGQAIRVEHVSEATLIRELARQGVARDVIPMVAVTEANQSAGHFDVPPDATIALLGRRPSSLSGFLHKHATALKRG